MAETPELPPKKDVATALMQGPSVYVHLDPRRDNVVVPKWLKNQAQLVLQVGLNMAVRIPDLEVGDDGISCTLSFNRSPFWCFMPWTAIYGLVGEDGRGMIWPDDVPSEIAKQRAKPTLVAAGSSEEAPSEAAPALHDAKKRVIKRPKARPGAKPERRLLAIAKDESSPGKGADDKKKKLPPYLRVIK